MTYIILTLTLVSSVSVGVTCLHDCDKHNSLFHLKCAHLCVAPAGEWMGKDCM